MNECVINWSCYGENVTELRFGCSLLKNPVLRDKWWVKGKIALLRKLAILGKRWTHVPKNQLPVVHQGTKGFKGAFQGYTGGGAMCKNHSQLQQSSWNWSCGGLTSIILMVLSTVNLQFQGPFIPISLKRFSELCQMEQLMSWLPSGHPAVSFYHLVVVLVSINNSGICVRHCYLCLSGRN